MDVEPPREPDFEPSGRAKRAFAPTSAMWAASGTSPTTPSTAMVVFNRSPQDQTPVSWTRGEAQSNRALHSPRVHVSQRDPHYPLRHPIPQKRNASFIHYNYFYEWLRPTTQEIVDAYLATYGPDAMAEDNSSDEEDDEAADDAADAPAADAPAAVGAPHA